MNLSNAIGGYFELELGSGSYPRDNSILLNSGRSCFEYILRTNDVQHVYMPKYICDAMYEPLKKLNIAFTSYGVNDRLEIEGEITLRENEFLVYVNYFGIKGAYSQQLSEQHGDRLILDCSQAFYFDPPERGHTFYSPRKFFGVPDGGCLVTNKTLNENFELDISYQRMSHLLKRIDEGAEAGFEDFKCNDASLSGQPIKQMSRLTRSLLGSIDFAAAQQARVSNYTFLHNHLGETNKLKLDANDLIGPMVYPYLAEVPGLRQRLIDQKIFVATYWPNVLESCDKDEFEYTLAQNILPLPIDQRYGEPEMQRILDVINS